MNEHPHIGFTGTRFGMNEAQLNAFREYLKYICPDPAESTFHHGDCIGADQQAAEIAHGIGLSVVCHPPIDTEHRAWTCCNTGGTREPKTHFARNRDIVDECTLLIATPLQLSRQHRGGTWYTVDYALKHGKHTRILWTNGNETSVYNPMKIISGE